MCVLIIFSNPLYIFFVSKDRLAASMLLFIQLHIMSIFNQKLLIFFFVLFVCVAVLQPSQPNGVMSSAISLPSHTFTGQA